MKEYDSVRIPKVFVCVSVCVHALYIDIQKSQDYQSREKLNKCQGME